MNRLTSPAARRRPDRLRPALPRCERHRAGASAVLGLSVLLGAPPALSAVQFTLTNLGTLTGTAGSDATAINASGVVVGYSLTAGAGTTAFVWDTGTLRAVGYSAILAFGINDSGALVGVSANHAFLETKAGAGYDLGTLGGIASTATAINAGGLIAGASTTASGALHATVWQSPATGTYFQRDLGSGMAYSAASALNASGQVVGRYNYAGIDSGIAVHAALWQAGSGVLQDLGSLGGSSAATGINDAGQVVGASDLAGGNVTHAFLYQGGYMQDLGTLGGTNSQAQGINARGLVVGSSDNYRGESHGFLRNGRGEMVDLNGLLVPGSFATVSAATAINANGQIAGTATISGQQRAVLLTPTGSVAWQSSYGGAFSDAANWEQGFGTSAFLDATVAPTGLQTINLFVDSAVKSLNVGGTAGSGSRPMLTLGSGATLTAAGGVTVQATGTLTGDGTIRGDLTNLGTLQASNLTITGNFINSGLVSGSGIVNANLNNTASGQVRSGAGDDLQMIGTAHSNAGTLDLRGGATQEYVGALTNAAGGRILINDGVLRADNGLTNAGQVQVSFGGATVYGAVTTLAGGAVILSGNSNSTFFDTVDVKSGGELRVSNGSTAVFFGQVNERTGSVFSGTGTKFYEGGLSIGSSPGLGIDAGSVNFGVANTYLAEIAGLAAGTGFDKYIVAGNLGFGGTLKVVAFGGYTFAAGQRFDLFDWGSSSGVFAAVDFSGAPLAAGLAWDTSALYATGEIAVTALAVPEPQNWALLLAGFGTVGLLVRRRGR